MDVTLLDALSPDAIALPLIAALSRTGRPRVHHRLRAERFATCQGCFECWIAHPGVCKVRDATNDVLKDAATSSEVIWALRPRFGCWDAASKQALDKFLGLLLPFFEPVEGETHHTARYPTNPRLGVVAVVDEYVHPVDLDRFLRLIARNALNLHQPSPWVAFVSPDATADELADTIAAARATPLPAFPTLPPFVPPPAVGVPAREDGRPRRALLLVGSAKARGTSVSEAMGQALLDRLAASGWDTATGHLAEMVKLGRPDVQELSELLEAVDLCVLATPVYIDCLPALVLAALDRLGAPEVWERRPVFVPIVQCGFPELTHTVLALEVLAAAAEARGLRWGGHLACGAGPALEGRSLAEPNGPATHVVRGLDLAAAALDRGEPVSVEASAEFGVSTMPDWLYRTMGNVGWVARAWQHGAAFSLGERTLAPS